MTILMLLDREFPPDIRVENEALSLIKQGHTIHLLSYNFGNRKKFEVYNGIQVHRFNISKQVANKSLGLILNLPLYRCIWMKRVTAFLEKNKVDAVHIHDLPLCILAAKIKSFGVKIIADMHENYPYLVAEQPYMKSAFGKLLFRKQAWFVKEKEWLGEVDEIVSVAEEMKARLMKEIGTVKNISVVPNTYSFNSFGAGQVEVENLKERFNGKFVVSYIGGFDPVRGIQYLIQAIALVKDQIPEIRLMLVGDGGIAEDLKQLAKTSGIDEQVDFEGWQPSSRIKSYIEASSVCVIPHIRSEQTDNSSPNKLFQYMYCRKPVISSNCSSLEKIIKGEKCGLIFKDKDLEDLAEKIIFLYKNPDQISRLGLNGYNAVMEKYNWEATVTPLVKIYSNPEK